MSAAKHTPVAALESLVAGLNNTNWSSWQTTAHFSDQLRAAEEVLRLEQVRAAAPELLEALQKAKDSLLAFRFMPGPGNAWEDSDEANLNAVDAAIAKATGSAS